MDVAVDAMLLMVSMLLCGYMVLVKVVFQWVEVGVQEL